MGFILGGLYMSCTRKILSGNPVSPGIAVAKAYRYEQLQIQVNEGQLKPDILEEKLNCFREAYAKTKQELQNLYDKLYKSDEEKAKIFMAHIEILKDNAILDELQVAIKEKRMYPDAAIVKVFEKFAKHLSGVEDPIIAGRATDLHDVKTRLLRVYHGKEEKNLSALTEEVIVITHDLMPSDVATLDRAYVKGIITEMGGLNSHSAILIRNFQIPAIFDVHEAMNEIPGDISVLMDALSGEIILGPTEEEVADTNQKLNGFLMKKSEEAKYLNTPGMTRDGYPIAVGINADSPFWDVPKEQFDFVGLFRTDFLYMEKTSLPTEEEQVEYYKEVLKNAKGNPVTLRTLDIGGDKILPYMELSKADNSFLGKRALRLCFLEKELFLTQLRAALRASAFGTLQIMFPMVSSMEDIYRAKECLKEAKRQLDARGQAYDKQIAIGIMIEIPSIALIADMVADEVDFASIGSNDLTQYVCACDRMNADISEYYQNYSPAMIRLLGHIFAVFSQKGKRVSVCGEMAGIPYAAVLLAGLGAKELSMNPASLSGVKAALAQVSLEEAKQIAEQCKLLKTEAEIKAFLNIS